MRPVLAYGLDAVKTDEYKATTKARPVPWQKDAETTAQIRLLDPQIVSPTFKQLQQMKQYYTFADTLAVDKYDIDGVNRYTVIAAREINLEGTGQPQLVTTTPCTRMAVASWPATATK